MADSYDVRLRVLGARQARSEMNAFGKSARQAGKDAKVGAEETKAGNEGVLAGMKGIVGLAAGAGVYEFFKGGIEGALGLNQSLRTVNNSLAAIGVHSQAVTQQLHDQADAASQHGGGTAEQELTGIAQFIQQTHNLTEAQKAQTAANKLAIGTGMSYAQAQQAISSGLAGRTRGLQRYLGIIQPVKTAEDALTTSYQAQYNQQQLIARGMGRQGSEYLRQWALTHRVTASERARATALDQSRTAQELLTKVNDRYGHSQESTAQRLSDLKHSFSNLEANISTMLIPVLNTGAKFLGDVAGWLDKNRTVAIALGGVIATLATVVMMGKLVKSVKSAANELKLASLASKLFGEDGVIAGALSAEGAGLAEGAWMAFAASTLIGLLIPAIGLLITHFGTVKKVVSEVASWVSREFGDIVHTVSGVVDSIERFFSRLFNKLISPFRDAINWIKSHAQDLNPLHWISKGVGAVGHFLGSILHEGGPVYRAAGGPIYREAGGPVGTDSVPMWGSPGEYVLPRSVVSQLGTPFLNNLVAGGGAGSAPEVRVFIEPAPINISGQKVAQIVLKESKKRSARGSTNLVGGNLSTSGAVA